MKIGCFRCVLLARDPEVCPLLRTYPHDARKLHLFLVLDRSQRGQVPANNAVELVFRDLEEKVVERSRVCIRHLVFQRRRRSPRLFRRICLEMLAFVETDIRRGVGIPDELREVAFTTLSTYLYMYSSRSMKPRMHERQVMPSTCLDRRSRKRIR